MRYKNPIEAAEFLKTRRNLMYLFGIHLVILISYAFVVFYLYHKAFNELRELNKVEVSTFNDCFLAVLCVCNFLFAYFCSKYATVSILNLYICFTDVKNTKKYIEDSK